MGVRPSNSDSRIYHWSFVSRTSGIVCYIWILRRLSHPPRLQQLLLVEYLATPSRTAVVMQLAKPQSRSFQIHLRSLSLLLHVPKGKRLCQTTDSCFLRFHVLSERRLLHLPNIPLNLLLLHYSVPWIEAPFDLRKCMKLKLGNALATRMSFFLLQFQRMWMGIKCSCQLSPPYLIEVPNARENQPKRRILERDYSVHAVHTVEPVGARGISKIHSHSTLMFTFLRLMPSAHWILILVSKFENNRERFRRQPNENHFYYFLNF